MKSVGFVVGCGRSSSNVCNLDDRYHSPYLASLIVALAILTYVPQISLWLPNLVFA